MKPTIGVVNAQTSRTTAAESGHESSISVIPMPLHYTQTRVVPVDEALLRQKRILTNSQTDEVASAYKVLRTQVLQRLRAHQWNTIGVTSPRPGEGKTLTAINLAISLAREVNVTVLLVDLDLRRPTVHHYFGYQPTYGFSDYLLHGRPLTDILFNPGIQRLVVLPGRESVSNSSEMLNTSAMLSLMEELKKRYMRRVIIFDLPPLLNGDDVLVFAPQVDATLLVVAEGKTMRTDLARAQHLLEGTNLLGTVLNRASEVGQAYYY